MSNRTKKAEKYDGKRGQKGSYGKWFTLEDATELVEGHEEWWKTDVMQPIQQAADVPPDKPVWMFENGDMYFGEWKVDGPNGWPVEHGFGITHYYTPREDKGIVYAGSWKDGVSDGYGETYWLKSSQAWRSDYYGRSVVTRKFELTGRRRGVPYHYKGLYRNGRHDDPNAIVTLKDGTTRIGPWRAGMPVGDWFQQPPMDEAAIIRPSVAHLQRQDEPDEQRKPDTFTSNIGCIPPSTDAQENNRKRPATVTPTEKAHRKSPASSQEDGKRAALPIPGSRAGPLSSQETKEERNRAPSAPGRIESRPAQQAVSPLQRPPPLPRQRVPAPQNPARRNDVNQIYDSDTEPPRLPVAIKLEPDADPTTPGGSKPPAPHGTALEKQRRLQQIEEYITHKVIGHNPNPFTMAEYAAKLYELGFSSVAIIQTYLKQRHIESFEWMAFLHKEIFLEKVVSAR